MTDGTLIEAINAGGNLGILAMGFYMMRLTTRVSRLEIAQELRQEMKKNG